MHKFNSDILDKLENRLLQGLLGEEDLSASVMEILRRVLHDNGRITGHMMNGGQGTASSLDTPGGEGEGEDVPDYGGKVLNFK